jgi:predicted nucleotidyltransferase
MPKRSSTSAGITYLDKNARLSALRQAARRARQRDPAISRVILFGSLVSGIPTIRSDADLFVIVHDSPHAHPRDRVPDMLAALSPLPCPIDLFVVTELEVEGALANGAPLVREAMAGGIELLQP